MSEQRAAQDCNYCWHVVDDRNCECQMSIGARCISAKSSEVMAACGMRSADDLTEMMASEIVLRLGAKPGFPSRAIVSLAGRVADNQSSEQGHLSNVLMTE